MLTFSSKYLLILSLIFTAAIPAQCQGPKPQTIAEAHCLGSLLPCPLPGVYYPDSSRMFLLKYKAQSALLCPTMAPITLKVKSGTLASIQARLLRFSLSPCSGCTAGPLRGAGRKEQHPAPLQPSLLPRAPASRPPRGGSDSDGFLSDY